MAETRTLPVLPLRGMTVFPYMIIHLDVGRERSMAATLAGTCKEILGTCVSVGCTCDGQDPRALQSQIDEGTYEIPPE